MNLSDLDLIDLAIELYGDSKPADWDLFWGQADYSLTAALRRFPEQDVLIQRGSVSPLDWLDDIVSEARCEPADPLVGYVPLGFYQGLTSLYQASTPLLRPHPIIIGHSLGAARAVAYGAMLAAQGRLPARVVGWGCPRPGMERMRQALISVPVRLYRNRSDPVTEVPVPLPPLLDWQHPVPQIQVDAPPADDDSWGLLADHHIELYRAAMIRE